jgi:murein DD-endopeptidase MepM/ murein hydrolase activator NlpD
MNINQRFVSILSTVSMMLIMSTNQAYTCSTPTVSFPYDGGYVNFGQTYDSTPDITWNPNGCSRFDIVLESVNGSYYDSGTVTTYSNVFTPSNNNTAPTTPRGHYKWKVRGWYNNQYTSWSKWYHFYNGIDKSTWYTGNYGSCDADCGSGYQYRTVYCEDNGTQIADEYCDGSKPSTSQSCTGYDCYYWYTGSYGSCDEDCGWGDKYRTVYCKRESNNSQVSDSYCSGSKPSTSKSCYEDDGCNDPPSVSITRCPSSTLTVSSYEFRWSGSDPDGDGDIDRYYYDLDDSTPDTSTSSTSKTISNLSEGSHVFYVKAKDNNNTYSSVKSCSFTVNFGYHWVEVGNWGACTGAPNNCGQGTQTQFVDCRDINGNSSPGNCSEADKPADTRTCNIDSGCVGPVATITSISPANPTEGETVSFDGSGNDSDGGDIQAYSWRSSLDGQLSNQASFSTSALSIGSHTIYFKVKDDEGEWSSEVSQEITINPELTYNDFFDEAGETFSVPSNLLRAIAQVESRWCDDSATYDGPGYNITQLEVDGDKLHTYLDLVVNQYSEYNSRADLINLIKIPGDAGVEASIRVTACKLHHDATNDDDLVYDDEPLEALETWWFVVTAYNGGGKDGLLTTSNYPFRVYNCFLNGITVNGEVRVPQIPITLPPHFEFRKARQDELDNSEISSTDPDLIPSTPPDFIRITHPFHSKKDMGFLHGNDGNLIHAPESEFILSFPLRGCNAYNAPINAVFDYSSPNYNYDEFVISYTGEMGEKRHGFREDGYSQDSGENFVINGNYMAANLGAQYLFYDGHPGIDYKTGYDANLYSTGPGTFNYWGGKYNIGFIDHNNGYRTYYLHTEYYVFSDGDQISAGGILIGISGDKGSEGGPHLHLEIRKQIGNTWVEVDPYGWRANEEYNWTKAINAELWSSNGIGGGPSFGFWVTVFNARQVNLEWDSQGITPDSYHIYRDGTEIASMASFNSYTDIGLEPETGYCYELRAYGEGEEISVADPVCITTGQRVGFLAGTINSGIFGYTVSIKNTEVILSNDSQIYTTVSDEKGGYTFNEILIGEYDLEINSDYFATTRIDSLSICEDTLIESDVNLSTPQIVAELNSVISEKASQYQNLSSTYTVLSSDHRNLSDTHVQLVSGFIALSGTYAQLVSDYQALSQTNAQNILVITEKAGEFNSLSQTYLDLAGEFTDLSDTHVQLVSGFSALSGTYAQLVSDYQALSQTNAQNILVIAEKSNEFAELSETHVQLISDFGVLSETNAILAEENNSLSRIAPINNSLQLALSQIASSYEELSKVKNDPKNTLLVAVILRTEDNLCCEYQELSGIHSRLVGDYANLTNLYAQISSSYSELTAVHLQLASDYSALSLVADQRSETISDLYSQIAEMFTQSDVDQEVSLAILEVEDQRNFDIDMNGKSDALTDGILIIRYLFRITEGSPLFHEAVDYTHFESNGIGITAAQGMIIEKLESMTK